MLGTIFQDPIGLFPKARCIRRRLSLLPLTLLAYNGTVWANGESLPEGVSGHHLVHNKHQQAQHTWAHPHYSKQVGQVNQCQQHQQMQHAAK